MRGRKSSVIEYYDPEIKERYIDENHFAGERLKKIRRIFTQTKMYEEEFGKDVSSFVPSEIGEMFRRIGFSSENAACDFVSYLRTYAYWSLEQNLIYSQINYYGSINAKDIRTFLNKVSITKKIVSREEIESWCEYLADDNPVDAFCLMAIFEGIGGDNWIDFCYLKIKDFWKYWGQWNVRLKSGREIKVSDDLKQYADQANEQTRYIVYRNEFPTKRELVQEDLIVKKIVSGTGKASDDFAKGRMFYTRVSKVINRVKDYSQNPALTVKGIKESGMVYYSKLLFEEMGMDLDDFLRTEELKDLLVNRFCLNAEDKSYSKQKSLFLSYYRDFFEKNNKF